MVWILNEMTGRTLIGFRLLLVIFFQAIVTIAAQAVVIIFFIFFTQVFIFIIQFAAGNIQIIIIAGIRIIKLNAV